MRHSVGLELKRVVRFAHRQAGLRHFSHLIGILLYDVGQFVSQ
jgi:hypothetical protein